jgi:hypothetical protein
MSMMSNVSNQWLELVNDKDMVFSDIALNVRS